MDKTKRLTRECLDVVLYTELKYKRVQILNTSSSVLVYLGVDQPENLPRVLPYNEKEEKEPLIQQNESVNLDDEKVEVPFELDESYLKSLDPKLWKSQDHYAVLGLQSSRYYASDDE